MAKVKCFKTCRLLWEKVRQNHELTLVEKTEVAGASLSKGTMDDSVVLVFFAFFLGGPLHDKEESSYNLYYAKRKMQSTIK